MQNNLHTLLIENDLNPFILFDSDGKLKDFNKEAEFLLNIVSYKELFDIAVSNASQTFGINKKFMPLSYGKSDYYAIVVAYINDDELALRLFKEVSSEDMSKYSNDNVELVNIYSLIDLSKNTTLLNSNIAIEEFYDISIPELKININNFLLTLNECFSLYINEDKLSIKVSMKIGEYELINEIKHNILSIEFKSSSTIIQVPKELKVYAAKSNIDSYLENNILRLDFTMIK